MLLFIQKTTLIWRY